MHRLTSRAAWPATSVDLGREESPGVVHGAGTTPRGSGPGHGRRNEHAGHAAAGPRRVPDVLRCRRRGGTAAPRGTPGRSVGEMKGGRGGGGRGARRNWDARAPRLSPAGEIPRGKIAASSPHPTPLPRPLCARSLCLSSLTRRPPILRAFGAGGRHALSSGCDVNTPSLLASRAAALSCPALVRPRIRPTSSLGHHHYLWNARGRRLSCRGRLKEAAARGALLALGASCPLCVRASCPWPGGKDTTACARV